MKHYRIFAGVFFVLCISVLAGCSISFSDSEVSLIDESTLQVEAKHYPADKLFDEIREIVGFAVSSDLEIPRDLVTYSYDEIDIREFLFELFGEQDIAFLYVLGEDHSSSIIHEVFPPVVDVYEIEDVFDVQFKRHESEVLDMSFEYPLSYTNDGCPYHYIVESYAVDDFISNPYELIRYASHDASEYDDACMYQDKVAPNSISLRSFENEDAMDLSFYPTENLDWYGNQGRFILNDRVYYFLAGSEGGTSVYFSLNDIWYVVHMNEGNDFSGDFVDESYIHYPFSFFMSVIESLE